MCLIFMCYQCSRVFTAASSNKRNSLLYNVHFEPPLYSPWSEFKMKLFSCRFSRCTCLNEMVAVGPDIWDDRASAIQRTSSNSATTPNSTSHQHHHQLHQYQRRQHHRHQHQRHQHQWHQHQRHQHHLLHH